MQNLLEIESMLRKLQELPSFDRRMGECYLIGPNNAGAKSALFLRVALIRADVEGAAVKGTF